MKLNAIPQVDIGHVRRFEQVDFIDNDFAIFDDVSDLPLKDFPSRMNASVLSLCLSGSYRVAINLQEYTLTPHVLLVTLPDQIIQNLSMSDDFSGIFIVVSKEFVNDLFPRLAQMLSLMFDIKENPVLALNQEDVDCLSEYHSFLWKKVKMTHNMFRKEITQGILLSLYYDLYNMYQRHKPKQVKPLTRKEELLEKFLREVLENYKTHRSVSFYADRLCLTAKHLSGVVKEVSGKTAGVWIDDFVTLEAKALLASSDMSIQEIAESLHFANQSFFGKYFKHFVGVSPKEYRKR
ncbi:MAG: helix-turn-helix domain-containing protein [Bacteroides sp.]